MQNILLIYFLCGMCLYQITLYINAFYKCTYKSILLIPERSSPSNDHNKMGDSGHIERAPWPHKTRGLRHQQPHIRRDAIPFPGRPEFPFPVSRDRGSRSGPLHTGLTNTVTVVYLAEASLFSFCTNKRFSFTGPIVNCFQL